MLRIVLQNMESDGLVIPRLILSCRQQKSEATTARPETHKVKRKGAKSTTTVGNNNPITERERDREK